MQSNTPTTSIPPNPPTPTERPFIASLEYTSVVRCSNGKYMESVHQTWDYTSYDQAYEDYSDLTSGAPFKHNEFNNSNLPVCRAILKFKLPGNICLGPQMAILYGKNTEATIATYCDTTFWAHMVESPPTSKF